jgi:hypothetical protein
MTMLEPGPGTGVLAGDHRMLIDGKLETTASGALFDILNPYFGLTSALGGYRQSGLGRRNGGLGFEEYLEIKTIGLPA